MIKAGVFCRKYHRTKTVLATRPSAPRGEKLSGFCFKFQGFSTQAAVSTSCIHPCLSDFLRLLPLLSLPLYFLSPVNVSHADLYSPPSLCIFCHQINCHWIFTFVGPVKQNVDTALECLSHIYSEEYIVRWYTYICKSYRWEWVIHMLLHMYDCCSCCWNHNMENTASAEQRKEKCILKAEQSIHTKLCMDIDFINCSIAHGNLRFHYVAATGVHLKVRLVE